MYQNHQDGELVESCVETVQAGLEKDYMVPNLTESVSVAKDGRIHVTMTNLSLTDSQEIQGYFADSTIKSVKGTVLTGDMRAHNTFENPNAVHTEDFTAVTAEGNRMTFTIPACSLLHLEVEI